VIQQNLEVLVSRVAKLVHGNSERFFKLLARRDVPQFVDLSIGSMETNLRSVGERHMERTTTELAPVSRDVVEEASEVAIFRKGRGIGHRAREPWGLVHSFFTRKRKNWRVGDVCEHIFLAPIPHSFVNS